jgi:uncharacterized protein YjbI with pentapeptide repeats
MTEPAITEAWKRLIRGKPLHGLNLPIKNGRVDLRSLHLPEPYEAQKVRTTVADVVTLGGITTIRGGEWKSIDFSSSQLPSLRLFDCKITDCVFDRCYCRDWRVWGTAFIDTTFKATDLRSAVLGGVIEGRRNSFRNVDFSSADLRQTVYEAAEFIRCIFSNSKLDKVDFETSTFVDCSFEGELREVIFNSRGFGGEAYPANQMTRVDFRHARLRWSEFHGLDLDNVYFPEDDEHIVVQNFPEVIDRALKFFGARSDVGSKQIAAVLQNDKRWLGRHQKVGILNKADLREMAGEEGIRDMLAIIAAVNQRAT